MLEGYDDIWQSSGNKKEISYTNIPYGNYKFKVLAANGDGTWNKKGALLSFYIKPSFFETQLFYWIIGFSSIGLGLFIYNWRIRSLNHARQELALIVDARTSEIMHQKEEIQAQKEAIEVQRREIEEKNAELRKVNLQLEDIVEERTDQLRKTYKELLEVNKELDTFIYRSVHDVRGPIARLQGLSNLLSIEARDPKIHELVNKLSHTADEMNDIFYRLLNIVRLRAIELQIKEIDIRQVIDDILVKLMHDKEKPEIKIEISSDFLLFSDHETIENIFYHLIDNAIKFKRDGHPAMIDIGCSKMKSGFVSIKFTDYGIGLSQEIADKIFDMFFVGHDQIAGAGLGLYTVKTAVKILNGRVRYLHEEGKTTFEIIIPANIG